MAKSSLSLVSLTPGIIHCHKFSVIAGVVDTVDKFITRVNAGDNDKDTMEVGRCQG